jgi:hypothetical protein
MRSIFFVPLMLLATVTFSQKVTDSAAYARQQPKAAPEEKKSKFDPNRLTFGGFIGASFGDYTFVNLSPQVGYFFTDYFAAGGGLSYIGSSQKVRDGNGNEVYRYSSNYAGINLFGRVFPVRFLMLSLQPELNYFWGKLKYSTGNLPDENLDSRFVPVLLAGAGVVMGRGGRGGMTISIQYDLFQNDYSPYGKNAFVNFGFMF